MAKKQEVDPQGVAQEGQQAEAAPQEGQETSGDTDAAAQQVQEQVDTETEQGYRGQVSDPTPNENYTLEGVISGAPTPETDAEAARKARDASNQR